MNRPRHILVTGATQGTGLALAEHYLRYGDVVVGCGRGESTAFSGCSRGKPRSRMSNEVWRDIWVPWRY